MSNLLAPNRERFQVHLKSQSEVIFSHMQELGEGLLKDHSDNRRACFVPTKTGGLRLKDIQLLFYRRKKANA